MILEKKEEDHSISRVGTDHFFYREDMESRGTATKAKRWDLLAPTSTQGEIPIFIWDVLVD